MTIKGAKEIYAYKNISKSDIYCSKSAKTDYWIYHFIRKSFLKWTKRYMAASFSIILINLRFPIDISLNVLNGLISTFFTNMLLYWLKIFYCTSSENESIMSLYPMILTSTRLIRFWNNLNDIHCIYFAGFVTGKDIENVYILTITQYSCISIHSISLFFISESFLMTSMEVWLSIDDIIIVSSREINLYRI